MATRPADPDALAALEAERDFLLKSLQDLDLEHEAGDLDDDDHAALTDDYTRRAAEVLRAIEAREAALRSAPRRSWRQAAFWVVGLVLVGAVAGVLVARSSGTRVPGGVITGVDISTVREKLAIAQASLGDPGRWDDAIALYDEVLDEQPANAEALTYKGWLLYRTGDADNGMALIADAVAANPEYPDARVLLAIALRDAGRFDEASAQLAAFDILDAPPMLAGLVEGQGLRDELNGRRLFEELAGAPLEEQLSLEDLAVSPAEAVGAANWLAGGEASELPAQRLQVAVRLFDIVLAADPDDVDALVSKGWLYGLTGQIDLYQRGLALIERAIELDPGFVEAYLLQAQLLAQTDPGAALAVLDELARVPGVSRGALEQADELRELIEAGTG